MIRTRKEYIARDRKLCSVRRNSNDDTADDDKRSRIKSNNEEKSNCSISSSQRQRQRQWNYYKSQEEYEAVESAAKAYTRQQIETNITNSLI